MWILRRGTVRTPHRRSWQIPCTGAYLSLGFLCSPFNRSPYLMKLTASAFFQTNSSSTTVGARSFAVWVLRWPRESSRETRRGRGRGRSFRRSCEGGRQRFVSLSLLLLLLSSVCPLLFLLLLLSVCFRLCVLYCLPSTVCPQLFACLYCSPSTNTEGEGKVETGRPGSERCG